ncbi:formyltetrahydrofolate deformylase [Dasania marina]|uniref:formyltetrahydrofolate deformylase n=1 Tax=Dasania marina TaxID=471499 RepID=UPI0030DB979F|tara:strand:- start:47971 stop:48843 length:873 start_codon:yes stop_codon:yes gene_type:complete
MSIVKTNFPEFILKVSCPAASGIVAGVTSFLSERGAYISDLSHFDDNENNGLFMRARFHIQSGSKTLQDLQEDFPALARKHDMQWKMVVSDEPTKTLIMVSQYDHCLDNILYRLRKNDFNMKITAVVSNHLNLRPMAEREGIRFVHLPITKENKPQQEQALLDIIDETQSELIVLARYMQILSDDLCEKLSGKAINIHHSFLPGFKGAKPYHQAHTRGVKLIGATAHYVTADLDEGPIIGQEVQEVDHTYSSDMLVSVGRDTETRALAKAVKLHTEHRVFIDGNKTIIFK